MKFSEAVDYAVAVTPRTSFPVHEGIMKSPGFIIQRMGTVLEKLGVAFTALGEGETKEF